MEFVIGGFCQGKTEYVKKSCHLEEKAFFDAACEPEAALWEGLRQGRIHCILHFHLLVRTWQRLGQDPEKKLEQLLLFAPKVITADELGCGIVPIEQEEREYREAAGRLSCRLAAHATVVTRVVCGIPSTICDRREQKQWFLLRHGMTYGNKYKKYIGITDESLSREGKEQLYQKQRQGLYEPLRQCEVCVVSPMKRCLETARLLCPKQEKIVVDQLQEMNFGIFENQNYEQLKDNREYQKWLEQGCRSKIPQGESRECFEERIFSGMQKAGRLLQERGISNAVFIVHGGTVMAYLSQLFHRPDRYYELCPGHGEGYLLSQTVSAGSNHLSVDPFGL